MIEDRRTELEASLWWMRPAQARQWQAITEAFVFGWGVRELRRVRAPDAEQIITDKLIDWEPSIIH